MLLQAPDFVLDPIGFLLYHWYTIVIFTVTIFIVGLLYWIVTRFVKSSLKSLGMGTEAATGIVLVLRLVFFVIAVFVLVGFINQVQGSQQSAATILSISTLFGTAIGLAFSQAIGNIVSGLYVFAARPFRVGDYVRIGSVEGIVREITLNYTKVLMPDETLQLVPNSKVVTSEVTNFRIDVRTLIAQKEEQLEVEGEESYKDQLEDVLEQLKALTDDHDAYRYTFDLTVHMSHDHGKMIENFDRVCDEWTKKFVARPTYSIWSKPNAGITYRFAFIVKKPMLILKDSATFMKDLLKEYWK